MSQRPRRRPHSLDGSLVEAAAAPQPASDSPEEEETAPLRLLRGNWKFAAVAQFLHTFHEPLRLSGGGDASDTPPLETQDLESAFLNNSLDETTNEIVPSPFLRRIVIRLLVHITDNRLIHDGNWLTYLWKIWVPYRAQVQEIRSFGGYLMTDRKQMDADLDLERFRPQQPQPQSEGVCSFAQLSLQEKLTIVHDLTEMIWLYPERFKSKLKPDLLEEEVYWRVQPMGYDAEENVYWMFDDNRVYVEEPERRHKADSNNKRSTRTSTGGRGKRRKTTSTAAQVVVPACWYLKCQTWEEWNALAEQFQDATHPNEKQLHDTLQQMLPQVRPFYLERKKKQLREIADLTRKRSSRLEKREQERLEQQRAEEEQLKLERAFKLSSEHRRQAREGSGGGGKAAASSSSQTAAEKAQAERERRIRERQERAARIAERGFHSQLVHAQKESLRDGSSTSPSTTAATAGASLAPQTGTSNDNDESTWMFRCLCGVHRQNWDDGLPMIACERCNHWQHLHCVRIHANITGDLDWENREFVCKECRETIDALRSPVAAYASSGGAASDGVDMEGVEVEGVEVEGAEEERVDGSETISDEEDINEKEEKGEEKQNVVLMETPLINGNYDAQASPWAAATGMELEMSAVVEREPVEAKKEEDKTSVDFASAVLMEPGEPTLPTPRQHEYANQEPSRAVVEPLSDANMEVTTNTGTATTLTWIPEQSGLNNPHHDDN